jgi:hypothetical protein
MIGTAHGSHVLRHSGMLSIRTTGRRAEAIDDPLEDFEQARLVKCFVQQHRKFAQNLKAF